MLKVFGVRDSTAGFFFPPFFARSDVEAKRNFAKLMNDPSRTGAKAEYDLFSLGQFDDSSGLFDFEVMKPVHLMNGVTEVSGVDS